MPCRSFIVLLVWQALLLPALQNSGISLTVPHRIEGARWFGCCAEGDARGQLVTLDADGAVVNVSERAEEADEDPPAYAAAAAWGRGPHEVRLGTGTRHDPCQHVSFPMTVQFGRLLKCTGSKEADGLKCSRACLL